MSQLPTSTRIFALCGIAAVVFYVLGHALAAGLRPDYSVIQHTISMLGERGGPYALLFVYLGAVPYGRPLPRTRSGHGRARRVCSGRRRRL